MADKKLGKDIILLKDLHKYFGNVQAVKAVNLTIRQGEVVVVVGPSGSGKSTVLRCINHLEVPTLGEVWIDGVHLEAKGTNINHVRAEVGMVFQQFNLFAHLTALENITIAQRLVRKRDRAEAERIAMQQLARVGIPEKASAYPRQLSGGQQQRVALARALVAEPRVILFDEPLSNLDAKLREETRKELRAFLEKLQITAVYVTHDRVEALALSDMIAVMRSGRIVELGTPEKIYFDADDRFVADFIGRANLVNSRVRGEEGGLTVVDCPLGAIACQRRDFPAGGEATLCIRPEFIHVARGDAPAGRNVVNGRIETLVFVGEHYETEIRVGDSTLLARVDPDAKFGVGEAVNFTLDPAHCLLVAA